MRKSLTRLALFFPLAASLAHAQNADLPSSAQSILTKYCAECHAATAEGGVDYISDLGKLVERKKVIPGQSGQSRILQRMQEANPDAKMPPPYASYPEVTREELAIIKEWIEAGAKNVTAKVASAEPDRASVSTRAKLESLHKYLKKLPKEDRPFQRFFTLDHLSNLPVSEFSSAQLRSVRAATSKVLNSLSWKPDMILPKPIDEAQTILAFDIRDVDWDASHSPTQIDFWQYASRILSQEIIKFRLAFGR